MQKKITSLILFSIIGWSSCMMAQTPTGSRSSTNLYREGVELFVMEKYAAASALFTEVLNKNNDRQDLDVANALFYKGLCAIRLYNNDADGILLNFIRLYPSNSKVPLAYFHLGNFYHTNRRYADAKKMYTNIRIPNWDKQSVAEYYYKLGYCYFVENDYEQSKSCFAQVTNRKGSKYATPANYYYAHILYIEGRLESALTIFESLLNDRNFKPIVPYYITHIYYLQEKYDELLNLAPQLVSSVSARRSPEVNRMLGEAYCKKGRYPEAIALLTKNTQNSLVATVQDYYLVGYAFYKTQNYEHAIQQLSQINTSDSLAQNAFYLLGECYLKTNDLLAAKGAFQIAAKMQFDPIIAESSSFNYAKLTTSTASLSMTESIDALQSFITTFPQSQFLPEAKELLAEIYASTRNYKEAITLMEEMKQESPKLKKSYQRVTLNRGIEVFNEGDLTAAITLFDKSLKYEGDPSLTLDALYLRAEAYYRTAKYQKAEKDLLQFYAYPNATTSAYYIKSEYLMGYTQFSQKRYRSGLDYFSRYLKNGKNEDPKFIVDAHLRLGDCFFMNKSLQKALEQYNLVIQKDLIDLDYALYQKALCFGGIGAYEKKIKTLTDLIQTYPNSSYLAGATFELANTHLILENNQQAIKAYSSVITSFPNSPYIKESLAKKGMTFYKINQDDKALQTLDILVRKYPTSEEAKVALSNIRSIYVERNQVDELFAYLKTLPHGEIEQLDKDSLAFRAAENMYMSEKYAEAIPVFENYIKDYPRGTFLIPAHFFLGDCALRTNKKEKALPAFEYIVEQPTSKFTERALTHAATLSFEQKQYPKAQDLFLRLSTEAESNTNRLQGNIGLMRSALLNEAFITAKDAAESVLKTPKVSEIVADEAKYTIVLAYRGIDSIDNAISYLNELKKSKNGDYAGEAYFLLAEREFNKGLLEVSEKIIYEISANPRSEYWLAKSFILWGDIFAKRGNTAQALQTYQSIIDNYDGNDLKSLAQQRANALNNEVIEKEQESETIKEEEEISL